MPDPILNLAQHLILAFVRAVKNPAPHTICQFADDAFPEDWWSHRPPPGQVIDQLVLMNYIVKEGAGRRTIYRTTAKCAPYFYEATRPSPGA